MTKSELILKLAERNPHLYQRDVERTPPDGLQLGEVDRLDRLGEIGRAHV